MKADPVEIEHIAEPVDEAAAWDAVIAILLGDEGAGEVAA